MRISNIRFTLEDPKPRMAELREMAVADAKSKAEHLAELSDVAVGRLIYISEGSRRRRLSADSPSALRLDLTLPTPPPQR